MTSTATGTAVRRAYAPGSHGQIHYRQAGADETRSPLLMLHPFPGSGYLFDNFMTEMGRDRTVIAPDFPGFGMSDAPREAPGITGYAAAILELETVLGIGVFDVMGYHAGGVVAVELARELPQGVRKVITISAPVFSAEEREKFNARFSVHTPDERAQAMDKGWQIFKSQFWVMGPDPLRTWNIYLDGQKNPEVSSWGLRAVINYDLAAVLPTITQPILVLNPNDDLAPYTPRAVPLLKRGHVHDLPQWTHGMLDAETAAIARLVRAFLDA